MFYLYYINAEGRLRALIDHDGKHVCSPSLNGANEHRRFWLDFDPSYKIVLEGNPGLHNFPYNNIVGKGTPFVTMAESREITMIEVPWYRPYTKAFGHGVRRFWSLC